MSMNHASTDIASNSILKIFQREVAFLSPDNFIIIIIIIIIIFLPRKNNKTTKRIKMGEKKENHKRNIRLPML